jgi:hypothetical protein
LKPPSIPDNPDISSGKHTKNYGKSPFFMGKSTISMAIFNSYVKLPEGIYINQIIVIIDRKVGNEIGRNTSISSGKHLLVLSFVGIAVQNSV